jgi:hypothetical protein
LCNCAGKQFCHLAWQCLHVSSIRFATDSTVVSTFNHWIGANVSAFCFLRTMSLHRFDLAISAPFSVSTHKICWQN